ncbi:MAG: DUF2207 domain-containing protein [Clostridia bacterium]|nr:DUF2207 domain-containing protein [Clostridia bacterium]
MKRIRKFAIAFTAGFALLIAALCLCLNLNGGGKVYAYDPYYGFEYTAFHVEYDIRADRTMDVTLDLGVHYLGYESTGLLFDIPVNSGDRVRNLKAYELTTIDGEEVHLDYKVKNDSYNLVTVDMGDYSNKRNQTHYYRIKYEYAITKPSKEEKNAIFLNAIGFGHDADMEDVQVIIKLPDGFIGSQTRCYAGLKGTKNPYNDFVVNGNTITLNLDGMNSFNGVTFNMFFEEGVLSVKPDMTPYWIIVAACVVLALLVAVKFLGYNKDGLTPITNVEAPDEMDPLVMGKLIDNKVDKSDVTSLIYYWANKGYIKIDLANENNVELIRINKSLPVNAPNYQKRMYNALFGNKDIVKINSLACSFYTTVEAVTKEVNAENSKLYDGKSMGFAVLFALLGALFMGLTPIVLALTTISFKLFMIAPMFMIIPSFLLFAITQSLRQNRLKYTKKKLTLIYCAVIALAAVFTVIYILFTPSYVIEIIPKIILGAVGFAIIMLSTLIVSRTPAYIEKLNKIVGFRDFILHTEKEKLEMMLNENPELYYKVLPYAIVLGVSDIWANKFAALTIAPPSWCTNSYRNGVFNAMMFSSMMHRVNNNMTNTFISRPASASSGSFSGGGHGGFSGGGHGGGGSRGR